VFVGDEVQLDISFVAARARLANLIRGGSLLSVSEGAYGEGIAGLARVGPLGSAPAISRLVEVHVRDLAETADSAGLALRWAAAGPGGRLFPALDADLTLRPAGEQATVLALIGAYRPPMGGLGAGLDRAILHRVATATIRAFLSQVGDAIAHPDGVVARAGEITSQQPSVRLSPSGG
jgi:hypothetical protein